MEGETVLLETIFKFTEEDRQHYEQVVELNEVEREDMPFPERFNNLIENFQNIIGYQ